MTYLLDGALDPVASEMGFLECSADVAREAFLEWTTDLKRPMATRRISGTLSDVLQALLPLTSGECRRHVFVPTASEWVAYFDNSSDGNQAATYVQVLAYRIGCRGLRVCSIPDTIRVQDGKTFGRYGAVMLEVYGPEERPEGNTVRHIGAMNDGGRWSFDSSGEVLPFEDESGYSARRIKDRFTHQTLLQYTSHLGLRPFEESFYRSDLGSELCEQTRPMWPSMKSFTLEEIRADW